MKHIKRKQKTNVNFDEFYKGVNQEYDLNKFYDDLDQNKLKIPSKLGKLCLRGVIEDKTPMQIAQECFADRLPKNDPSRNIRKVLKEEI
jgi:hypothetical protein